MDDLVVFILTNRRPDRVDTYATLRKQGYTGPIRLIVDNEDPTVPQYRERYGDEVVVFDKAASAATFDEADNFGDRRSIVYARNACFDIARDLGFGYHVQLDDDYKQFDWRFDAALDYWPVTVRTQLDAIFGAILQFYKATPAASVAVSQGGDWIGGGDNATMKACLGPRLLRKCMNSFFCSEERRFQFLGRVNEDVNTYTRGASTGLVFLTLSSLSLTQRQTQSNGGGMADLYLESGTYVKSFYSVMFQPSSVTIRPMGHTRYRLHHSVKWACTVPKLLHERHRKP